MSVPITWASWSRTVQPGHSVMASHCSGLRSSHAAAVDRHTSASWSMNALSGMPRILASAASRCQRARPTHALTVRWACAGTGRKSGAGLEVPPCAGQDPGDDSRCRRGCGRRARLRRLGGVARPGAGRGRRRRAGVQAPALDATDRGAELLQGRGAPDDLRHARVPGAVADGQRPQRDGGQPRAGERSGPGVPRPPLLDGRRRVRRRCPPVRLADQRLRDRAAGLLHRS